MARDELEFGLRNLEKAAGERREPDRYDARALLVPLGERLAAGDAATAEAVRRALGAATAFPKAWTRAVSEELRMAVAEYVLSADPRFLDRPDYDFEYTERARERLQARLRAADALGSPLEPDLSSKVEGADGLFLPRLEAWRASRGK